MIIRKLSRDAIEKKPYEAWNAFVNLLATEAYDSLDEVQRIPYLCFWYDSEMQNGGHLQYFENRGTALLVETVTALNAIGAECQSRVLESAGRLYLDEPRERHKTTGDYVAAAITSEFGSSDAAYYCCEPSIQKLLAKYFEHHEDHFIEFTDADI